MLTRLNPLIHDLYATRLSPRAWLQWLDSLTSLLGCDAPAMAVVKPTAPRPLVLCGAGAQSAPARDDLEAFAQAIAAGRRCQRQLGDGGWFFEPKAPYGLWLWLAQPLWQRAELQLLWPHLCQWARVTQGPGGASNYLLTPLATAALVCGADGRVAQRNLEAERLLGSETVVPEAIKERVRQAAHGRAGGWALQSVDNGTWQLRVHPLEGGELLVLMCRPAATRTFACDDLMALYGLSPKEAKVAVELAVGYQPRQIAERLFVGESTVRSHIRQILAKSDSRSLNHLVARLHTGFSGLTCSALYPVVEADHAQAQ